MQRKLLTLLLGLIVVCISLCSCNTRGSNNKENKPDSVQIVKVLRDMYQWHAAHQDEMGFTTIVQDTLQTGLDTTKLAGYIQQLNATGFFSKAFLQNYRAIVTHTDYKLRNDSIKYFNEINFGFQEADPWTSFQDDAGNFWDILTLHDITIGSDTALLKWTITGMSAEDAYLVKFKKENNNWRISYMRGFDTTCCW